MFERTENVIGKENIEKIKNTTVLLIGLGGVGGYAFESLIRAGIGKIIIVDNDTFDETNLNRQLYSNKETINKYKVDILEENAKKISNTEIIKIEVSAMDNVLARDIASEIAKTFIAEVNNIFKLQNVTILSEAQIEKQPYNVSLTKQVTLSGCVGLFISIIVLFLIYYFDTSIKSVEAIENKANLTVLGTVEKVKGKNENK